MASASFLDEKSGVLATFGMAITQHSGYFTDSLPINPDVKCETGCNVTLWSHTINTVETGKTSIVKQVEITDPIVLSGQKFQIYEVRHYTLTKIQQSYDANRFTMNYEPVFETFSFVVRLCDKRVISAEDFKTLQMLPSIISSHKEKPKSTGPICWKTKPLQQKLAENMLATECANADITELEKARCDQLTKEFNKFTPFRLG